MCVCVCVCACTSRFIEGFHGCSFCQGLAFSLLTLISSGTSRFAEAHKLEVGLVGSEFYIRSENCSNKPLWPWPFCFACKTAIGNDGLVRMGVRHCFWADNGLLLDERLHNPKGLPRLENTLINRDWNKHYYEYRQGGLLSPWWGIRAWECNSPNSRKNGLITPFPPYSRKCLSPHPLRCKSYHLHLGAPLSALLPGPDELILFIMGFGVAPALEFSLGANLDTSDFRSC